MPSENSESNGHLRCDLLIIYHVKILPFVKKFNAVMQEENIVCMICFSTRVMSSHLFAKSVFLFLELTSELNANSDKFAFFTLDEFNLNDFR